jgi:membrane dipeptidase
MTHQDTSAAVEARIDQLQAPGIVDMHFDLLMDLYEQRGRSGVLDADYLPELALRVGLGQVARAHIEAERSAHFAVCTSYAEIMDARRSAKIALLITMEGVEPLGADLDMLHVFYQLGLRSVGLTHARRNLAGDGGIFAPSGSSRQGLTDFGRAIVRECDSLGIMLDLAHLNPAGCDDVLALAKRPPIISHTNPRAFYDIERNSGDEHIRAVGQRGGVVGVNAVLVSPRAEDSHLDRYVDHVEYVAELAGIEGVGIGFDFFEHIYRQWSAQARAELESKLAKPNFLPDLSTHAHARNLTRKLVARGWSDGDIAKVLYGNWMRVFETLLGAG